MQRFAVYIQTTQCRGYPPLPHIRVDSEPPASVLDASLCVQARSLSLFYESTSSHQKNNSIDTMLLFFCEREWMKNRCKATVRTAQQQRRRCVLSLSLCYTMQRFAIYLITVQRRGYPPSCLRQLYAFGVMLSSTVICLRRDICPSGKLWIYLSFGDRQNITLTKSKYHFGKVKI